MSELLELIIRAAIESRKNSGVRPVAPRPPALPPQQQPPERLQPQQGYPSTPTRVQPPARPAPVKIARPVPMKSPMKRVPPVIKQQKRVAAPQPPQVPLPPRKKSMETAPAMQIARGSAPQGTTPMLTADAISRIVASRPGALRNMFIMSEVIGKPVAFKST